jgi:hypothetical protein
MNMTNIKKPNLVDAYDMSQKCPDTFSIPSDDEIRLIKPNTFVKVCVEGKERFWVEVKLIEGDKLIGEVNNELVFTDQHGLKLKDLIEFEVLNIYDIFNS